MHNKSITNTRREGMKKYRIKQIGKRYHPQSKILFFWFYMYDGNALGSYEAWFGSIKEARKFIESRIASRNYKPMKIIHEY